MTDNNLEFSTDRFLDAINSERFAATVVETDREMENHITNMFQGNSDGWDRLYRWISQRADGTPEQRWAGILSAVSYAKRTIYTIDGYFPSEYPESMVQALIGKYQMGQDGELGLRDGLYIMTVARNPDETLEDDWVWYATPDCPSSRYSAILLLMFILIGNEVRNLAKASATEITPLEMWEGLRSRL